MGWTRKLKGKNLWIGLADHGPTEFSIPNCLKGLPLSAISNVSEIVVRFGGPDQLRTAVTQPQQHLYAA